jgi:tagaturonate reductase
MPFPILQFGTSRFLQAHVDLFVDQGFVEGAGAGKIAVVQTTSSSDSARRLAFFDTGASYVVRVRGLESETLIDEEVRVASIGRGLDANRQWADVERLFVEDARWIVSNTGDRGYELDAADASDVGVPRAFPAKLAKLLHARFRAGAAPLTMFPCELVEDNGGKLRDLVLAISREWRLGDDFVRWVGEDCLWINSLVDRIVSEPLEPAGAVAEPYALWAVEKKSGLVMPSVLNCSSSTSAIPGSRKIGPRHPAAPRRRRENGSRTPRSAPISKISTSEKFSRCSTRWGSAPRRATIARA